MTEDSSPETTPEPQSTPEPEPTPETPPAAPAPGAAPAALTPGGDDPAQENPTLAALSYIFCPLIGIIILVMDMKKSRYMRFHAFQSLFLTIAYVVIWSVYGVLSGITGIFALAGCLIGPAVLILSIVLAMKAYNKQEMLLPVIGQMAADQADKMSV